MDFSILRVNSITKDIGSKRILNNISFELEKGDVLGFIGPNGAGKTTTIKAILGMQKINKGSIYINGYEINNNYKKAIERVGAIIENADLYNHLSGMQIIKMISRLYNQIDNNYIKRLLSFFSLDKVINDKVIKYSLGMKQKLAIVIALINKPNLLILDEPTNGLDPESIIKLRKLIIELSQKEKVAIIISSHNLQELESICNKICIIKNGTIVKQILANKNLYNGYIIELNNIKNIKKYLRQKDLIIDNNTIKVFRSKKEIPIFIKKIIKKKYLVYSFYQDKSNLEKIFLKHVGETTND